MKKKLLSVLVSAFLVLALCVVSFASIQDTNELVETGKYFVIGMSPAETVFDADGSVNGSIFKWGLGNFLEPYDEGVKIKAGTSGELSVAYGSAGTLGIEMIEDTFVTSELKYFGMRYKTAEACTVGAMFMTPGDDANWDSWNNPDYTFYMEFPASEDYTVAVGLLPETMQFDENPFLFGWECQSAPADVFVTDIGFFASEEEAKNFADNYEAIKAAATETEPVQTEPDTQPVDTENVPDDTEKKEDTTKKSDNITTADTASADVTTDGNADAEGLSTGALIAIICGIVVVVCVVIVIISRKKK